MKRAILAGPTWRLAALLLFACPGPTTASWTGVEVSIANVDADWAFEAETREAQTSLISLQIEEKTATGLRIGVSLGYFYTRLVAEGPSPTLKFDGHFVGLYLNRLVGIGEHVEFYGQFNLGYHNGQDSLVAARFDIDWIEVGVELGASLRFAHYRVTPYVVYTDIDGDISNVAGIDVFERAEPVSRGIHLDYFVEPTAFVRLSLQGGGNAGGYLNFVRRY